MPSYATALKPSDFSDGAKCSLSGEVGQYNKGYGATPITMQQSKHECMGWDSIRLQSVASENGDKKRENYKKKSHSHKSFYAHLRCFFDLWGNWKI